MTLWVLCEHGEKGPHITGLSRGRSRILTCPGGREASREDLIEALGGEAAVMFHEGELTEDEARELARATIAKVKEHQRTEVTELLADIVQKATPYGTQDGGFVASYLLPTGPIHRAIPYLQERGIPTVLSPALVEEKP